VEAAEHLAAVLDQRKLFGIEELHRSILLIPAPWGLEERVRESLLRCRSCLMCLQCLERRMVPEVRKYRVVFENSHLRYYRHQRHFRHALSSYSGGLLERDSR
jgi:hypothetical protein